MTRITANDVRKVSKLARLEISEKDIQTYASQLEKILDYIAQLQTIDTSNILPTTRAVEVVNVIRDDDISGTTVREELLEMAPQREGDFFRVP